MYSSQEVPVKIIHDLDAIETPFEKSVLLIGNFDGVHRGHQQLLAQGALFAAADHAPLVLLTFDPHPLSILRPERAPEKLSTISEKASLLENFGVSVLIVAKTTPDLLAIQAEQFIEFICRKCNPTHIVEGATFRFGKNRRGTPELLAQLGHHHNYQACIIDPVRLQIDNDQTTPISSSVIRRLISSGHVGRAALCLGRPYTICGTVVSGAGRGKNLGFPTANLGHVDQLIPADGVYAGAAILTDGSRHLAGISIGTTPTFGGDERKIEAHLVDYQGTISRETIRVEFGMWIRKQKKFPSANELKQQIAKDIQAIRQHGLQPPFDDFPSQSGPLAQE